MWPPSARSYWPKLVVSLKSRSCWPFGSIAPLTSSWKRQMWGAASWPAAMISFSVVSAGRSPSVAITVQTIPCAT